MTNYFDRLTSEEFFDTLTKEFVKEEIEPRIAKALTDFGSGWYDEGDIHSREIEALIILANGMLEYD